MPTKEGLCGGVEDTRQHVQAFERAVVVAEEISTFLLWSGHRELAAYRSGMLPPLVSLLTLSLVLFSAFLHASWNAATKRSANPTVFFLCLEAATVVVCAPMLLFVDWTAFSERLWLLLAGTAVAHGLYSVWLTTAYERADLSLVYPISRSTPALTPLPAVLLLGERLSAIGLIGIAVVLVGIWVMQVEGRGDLWLRLRDPGLVYAYPTLLSTVVYSLIDKEGMATFDAAGWSSPLPRAVVYYYLMTALHLPFFWLFGRRRLSLSTVRQLVRREGRSLPILVIAALVSYSLILEILRVVPVSYVVAVRQTSVVFALLLGIFWLRERPGRRRLFGAALTLIGVALIGAA